MAMNILKVYVPAPGTFLAIRIIKGSGIVGRSLGPEAGGRIRIDYEGAKHNPSNIRTYEDKLFHAAGRHLQNYPTVARSWVPAEELIEIGEYFVDDETWERRLVITDHETHQKWTGK